MDFSVTRNDLGLRFSRIFFTAEELLLKLFTQVKMRITVLSPPFLVLLIKFRANLVVLRMALLSNGESENENICMQTSNCEW